MRILTRYLVRSHLGPFLFAFSLLTGLLFVNAIAQRLERLVGKGLPWDIIIEFVLLALPHTIALTLPLGILVAVLYTFSDLAAHSEIIAMSAGGIRPRRLLIPVLVGGVVLAGVTYGFNDRVLPEANHRLKNLSISIGQKSPTFQLKERVVNKIDTEDGTGPYFLKAERIDPSSAELFNIVIYDVSRGGSRRTTYAERGEMALNSGLTDLYLRLYDGHMYEVGTGEDGTFQRMTFDRQVVVMRGVSDVLERHDGDQRSDREMSVAMLKEQVLQKQGQLETAREEAAARSVEAVERALGIGAAADSIRKASVDGKRTTVFAQAAALPPDGMTQTLAVTTRTSVTRMEALRRQVNKHEVEIHKKYTIAFACIVFVLIGAPIGVRFPRGGVGMVISVSALVMSVYWMGLIGGEKLADKGLADPFWVMWAPNFVFLIAGAVMVGKMGNWVASARGGGWMEVWRSVWRWTSTPYRKWLEA
ncbi:MAG: YjgP/YjgQ family permease [Gemmatimonadetes bacterium]|nr:YjgP/YjgQ family permease [Gemmatimonadota bacterium]